MDWSATLDGESEQQLDNGSWYTERHHRRLGVQGDDVAEATSEAMRRYEAEVLPGDVDLSQIFTFKLEISRTPDMTNDEDNALD